MPSAAWLLSLLYSNPDCQNWQEALCHFSNLGKPRSFPSTPISPRAYLLSGCISPRCPPTISHNDWIEKKKLFPPRSCEFSLGIRKTVSDRLWKPLFAPVPWKLQKITTEDWPHIQWYGVFQGSMKATMGIVGKMCKTELENWKVLWFSYTTDSKTGKQSNPSWESCPKEIHDRLILLDCPSPRFLALRSRWRDHQEPLIPRTQGGWRQECRKNLPLHGHKAKQAPGGSWMGTSSIHWLGTFSSCLA